MGPASGRRVTKLIIPKNSPNLKQFKNSDNLDKSYRYIFYNIVIFSTEFEIKKQFSSMNL